MKSLQRRNLKEKGENLILAFFSQSKLYTALDIDLGLNCRNRFV